MKNRLIVGALPLLIYPFVALASIMSLAGHTTGNEPMLQMMVARSFQVASLLYPVVYVGSLIGALAMKQQQPAMAAKLAGIPLWFLALVVLLFFGWMAFGPS